MLLEQEFNEILVEAEEGYYRHTDLEPVLPYRGKNGMPATYWIQEGQLYTLDGSLINRREVNNLAVVKGVVYDDEGQRRLRLYRVGDLQPTPQLPVIGHRIVKEYINSFIELSRCWYPYSDQKVLGTGSVYKRFERFVKPEIMDSFDKERFHERAEYLNEVSVEYLCGRMAIPGQDHVYGVFLNRVARVCYTMIQPIAEHLMRNPWREFEIQRIQSNDFMVTDKGDFRINQWEAEHLPKKGV